MSKNASIIKNNEFGKIDQINQIDELSNLEDFDRIVHIRIRQRNRRKCATIIENVASLNLDDSKDNSEFVKELTKEFRKKFFCSVCIKDGNMELFGDHREEIKDFLIDRKIVKEENIKIHGF